MGLDNQSQGKEESIMGLMQVGQNNTDTRSQVSQAQSQVSQVSAVTYDTDMFGLSDTTGFLLLDLREPEEYEFWRLKEAVLYPAANISRDKMIPELYRFKNKADKLIIIYMGDERKGCAAANLFVEKGYDNIFLLSGGIE